MPDVLQHVAHRPWPLPNRPWSVAMEWCDLLFAHWRVDPAALRALVPRALELDTFDGSAWLGVVPFWMRGVRHRLSPPVPWLSTFPELNVRTYVRHDGRSGVWFFSLDATRWLAVHGARAFFRLPYRHARMRVRRQDGRIDYRSTRRGEDARFRATYRPIGPAAPAAAGTLPHWLAERYCLFALRRNGRVLRCDVHHLPWPLQPAEADITENTMAAPLGLALSGPPESLLYAARLDTRAWWPV